MIRTLALTAIAAMGFTVPAMAADTSTFSPEKSAELSQALDTAWQDQQARYQLMHNGYTHVAIFGKDLMGRYVGTAVKDGKHVLVAVAFPNINPEKPAID